MLEFLCVDGLDLQQLAIDCLQPLEGRARVDDVVEEVVVDPDVVELESSK